MMRANSLTLTLLFVAAISNSATAQLIHWEDPQNELWLDGVETARSFNRFGDCAHDDPALAVRACTQQLRTLQLPNSGSYQSDRAYRYTLRANARVKQGNFSRALSDYQRASAAAYGDIYWIHAYRANANFEAGDYQHALQFYNEAIELEPDVASLLNARARLLAIAPDADVRNGPQAIADARVAIALEPENPGFVATLAAAYAENGEFDTATEEQRRAIALLPEGTHAAVEVFQNRLSLYLQAMPYRAASISE